MITGRVLINIRLEPDLANEARDRRLLVVLEQCPDGAEVVIDIGDRLYASLDVAHWLHKHDHRLQIVIEGTNPLAVRQFVTAARKGAWSVVG